MRNEKLWQALLTEEIAPLSRNDKVGEEIKIHRCHYEPRSGVVIPQTKSAEEIATFAPLSRNDKHTQTV